MLILIAGITGNMGKHLAQSALNQGHQVRGLGRSPKNLPPELHNKLENFIISSPYYDIPAIEKAVDGVDAVICAYSGLPELQLDAQLILLRAAERAGVKRFHAASWNYDWRHLPIGTIESYDPYISFYHQVSLTSSVKPIYMFTGGFAEVYFSIENHGDFGSKNKGEWDPVTKELHIWGDGNQVLQWTTEKDAAEFSIEAITKEGADQGGEYVLCSGLTSLRDIAKTYEAVRGKKVGIVEKGTIQDLERVATKARDEGSRLKYWEYLGYFYSLQIIHNGKKIDEMDFDKFSNVKRTTLREFLEQNPDV